MMAGVIARSVLAMQAAAEPGTVPRDLEPGADLRLVVHQAAGTVSARLDVTVRRPDTAPGAGLRRGPSEPDREGGNAP